MDDSFPLFSALQVYDAVDFSLVNLPPYIRQAKK